MRRARQAIVLAMVVAVAAQLTIGSSAATAAEPTPTNTSLSNVPENSNIGFDVDVRAAVSPTPDGGSYELRIDGVVVVTQPWEPGFTTLRWHPEATGTYAVQVFYSGTSAFAASSSQVATVNIIPPHPTSITVQGSPNPAARNADVTFTATVLPNPGPGDVEWQVGQLGWIATTPLAVDGTATFTTSFENAGQVAIWARFKGNENWSWRISDIYYEQVNGDGVAVTIDVPGSPLPPGPVTANVTLTPNPGGGMLEWGYSPSGGTQVPVDPDGTTSIELGSQSLGSRTLYVRFTGYGNYAQATGQGEFTVADPTTTSITTNRTTAYQGELPVTLTATVTSSISLQGTVTFLDDVGGVVVELGPVAIDYWSKQATFSSSSLRPGNHSIRARYDGESLVLPSTSAPVQVTIHADTGVHASFAPSLSTFYPTKDGFRDTVRLGGTLSERASVTVRVYKKSSLKRTWSLGTLNAGSFGVTWNGKTKRGAKLPAGVYTVKVTIKDTKSHTATYSKNVTISPKTVTWKSVTVTRYAETGAYFVSTFGGAIYYSPYYPRGRILDSGEMIRDCTDCGFAAGQFIFSIVSGKAIEYRKLYIEIRGHGFSDREHPGSASLVNPATGLLALTRPNYEFDDPDVKSGIPFTSSYISSTKKVQAWVWMDQAWGDAYDLNYLKLTYQYAVWK